MKIKNNQLLAVLQMKKVIDLIRVLKINITWDLKICIKIQRGMSSLGRSEQIKQSIF